MSIIDEKSSQMDKIEEKIAQMLMEHSLELEIRNAGVFRYLKSYRFERHNHRETEIVYIKSGHCIMGVGEEFVPLKERDCIILYKGVPHWFLVDREEGCQIAQLEFYVNVPEDLKENLAVFRPARYHTLPDSEGIKDVIEGIGRLYRFGGNEELQSTAMKMLFLLLFLELSMRIEKNGRRQSGKMEKLLSYINENYEYDISIEELAEKFGVSSRYLRKCFKEETGISCSQYIASLRIEKAKEMLWSGSETVTEIAARAGFNSSQYFCRVFQQYTGMTPLEYRNMWKGTRAEERCTIIEEEEKER